MKEKEIITQIRSRLGIESLNEMQQATASASGSSILLLSPTGSGKTVAFTIAMLKRLGAPAGRVAAVVIAPTRELAMQIGGVVSKVAAGYRVVTLYGGHSMRDEAASLTVTPDIVIATPGRLLDHLNRRQLDISTATVAVLDEYDKSLELGFADEMRRLVRAMKRVHTIILTSATRLEEYPEYLNPGELTLLDFTETREGADADARPTVEKLRMISWQKDKLEALGELIDSLDDGGRTMVFVNHRESAERVFNYLKKKGLPAGLYHGGLEQNDREDSLEMFNNGTTPILVTTDLGSRGLDIAMTENIVHYHLPPTPQAWTHRNGRTGRLGGENGRVFIITADGEESVPEWVDWERDYHPRPSATPIVRHVATLYFNLGRREKISRGDIVGYLVNKGGLTAAEIGSIALRDHSALVAIPAAKAGETFARVAGEKIKNKRVKVSIKK